MRRREKLPMTEMRYTQDASSVAYELEQEKMKIKREMEKIMKQYAKLSGLKSLGKRAYKVGKSPNDWAGDKVKRPK